jgi:8-oxo-dGTP pyrophosphatase MutT (NUDIX family)
MAERDGNGWVRCGLGHRHWGRLGAAGLLAYLPGAGGATVLLQRRGTWGHHPGTWGPPGGAMDSHESAVHAALREAAEECDIPADEVSVSGILRDDHGGWSYQTVIAAARTPFPVRSASAETSEVGWISEQDVGLLALHPGFAEQWPALRAALAPLTVIVDVANVMGSRADGWWRDRAGAAIRLHTELTSLASAGLPGLPASVQAPALERWFPGFVLVLEGATRAALKDLPAPANAPPGPAPGPAPGGLPDAGRVRVAAAAGSGDDLIADLAARLPGRRLVVTADRELRGRCAAAGAAVTGPRWLLGLL